MADRSPQAGAHASPTAGRRFPLMAMRLAVVAPGAFAEGAFAVALPWMLVQAAQGAWWLGWASALIVAAGIAGNLAAPAAARRLGLRRMTVAGALISLLCVLTAGGLWLAGHHLPAFAAAVCALVADGVSDVGFSARTPALARLCGQPLLRFSGDNWLWGIAGYALGSLAAGWATEAQGTAALLLAVGASSLSVAAGLGWMLPRDGRAAAALEGRPARALSQLLKPALAVAVSMMVWLSFVFGPLDNLLLPAHLAAHGRSADLFGMMIAAGCVGLAAGLVVTHAEGSHGVRGRTVLLVAGSAGVLLQAALVWQLPSAWMLVLGVALSSALIAPLLPLLESALLATAHAGSRTSVVAAAGVLVSGADMAGTAAFGWVLEHHGSDAALAVCTLLTLPLMLLAICSPRAWLLPRR
jgi:hypothetical protein